MGARPAWNRDQTLSTSGGIDHFWLGTSLKLSADEQVNFLHRLLRGQLPFSDRTIGILKEIMIVNKSDDAVLRGKTGMGGPDNARLNLVRRLPGARRPPIRFRH